MTRARQVPYLPWEDGSLPCKLPRGSSREFIAPAYPPVLSAACMVRATEEGLAGIAGQLARAQKVALLVEDPSRPSGTGLLTEAIVRGHNCCFARKPGCIPGEESLHNQTGCMQDCPACYDGHVGSR